MGCDIHAHIEVKISGVWHHYSSPPITRNYRIFEKICGVRGEEINAIHAPRGFPEDASLVARVCYEYEKSECHSFTYLNRKEFCLLIEWAESNVDKFFQHKQLGYLTGSGFYLHRGSNPKEIEDVRFICWFDN
jgi:hypothetical protein